MEKGSCRGELVDREESEGSRGGSAGTDEAVVGGMKVWFPVCLSPGRRARFAAPRSGGQNKWTKVTYVLSTSAGQPRFTAWLRAGIRPAEQEQPQTLPPTRRIRAWVAVGDGAAAARKLLLLSLCAPV